MSARVEKLRQIKLAARRVETGRGHHVKKGAKYNISTVATEAQMSASTLHTRYPEMVEMIRVKMGKESRVERDKKQKELQACRARNRELLAEIVELKGALSGVTSRYATSLIRLKQLDANKGVAPFGKSAG